MAKMKCKAKALDVQCDPKTVDIFNISVVEIVQDKTKRDFTGMFRYFN